MPRIRSIKPEVWMSPQVMNLTHSSRLLFIGLITQADDEGRGSADLRRLKASIFGGDDVTSTDVRRWLDEVSAQALVVVYETDAHGLIYEIPTWKAHQSIDRPKKSTYPSSGSGGDVLRVVVDSSTEDRRGSEGSEGSEGGKEIVDSSSTTPRTEKLNGKAKATETKRRRPLPEDFDLNPQRQQYAEKHLPAVDAAALMAVFRSTSKAKGWKYVDWDQHWQTLVRQWAPNSGHWSSGQYPQLNGNAKGDQPWLDEHGKGDLSRVNWA